MQQHVRSRPELVGGLLVLNTPDEVAFAEAHLDDLPPNLTLVPPLPSICTIPDRIDASGWYKIHPVLHDLRSGDIDGVIATFRGLQDTLRGVMVHCFPWGPHLENEVSLQLVMELARSFPETPVLATHGGGYESWAYRAHVGGMKNVLFDFSMSLAYYSGADPLRPLQRYLVHSPDRVVFGSDWPSASPEEELRELTRLAREAGVTDTELEELLLSNSRRYWPAGPTTSRPQREA